MAIKESLAVMSASAAMAGGLAEMPSFATAQQQPEAVAASTTWSHLGGDPLVPGGIHSRHDFVRFVTSSKGHHALEMQGVSARGIAALDKAAHMGKERSCTMNVGDHFKSMVFGINGTSIDRDVTFTDPRYRGRGAAAYCLDATVKNPDGSTTKYETLTPQKCGNLALERVVRHKPKHKAVKQAIERVFKIAEDDQGHQLPETPTGTFRFAIDCIAKAHKLHKEVIYNQTPQELAKCDVGKLATVTELPTLGNEQWNMLTPAVQKQIVRKSGNTFTFKDQEVSPPTPPTPPTPPETPPQPQPPVLALETQAQEGFDAGSSEIFCADGHANPVTDGLNVNFSARHGQFSETTDMGPSGNGSDERYCATLTEAPNQFFTDEVVTVKGTDNKNGLTVTDSTDPFSITQPA